MYLFGLVVPTSSSMHIFGVVPSMCLHFTSWCLFAKFKLKATFLKDEPKLLTE